MRQGCVISPGIFIFIILFFIDRCMREMKVKLENVGARLKMNGMSWAVVTDYTVAWRV